MMYARHWLSPFTRWYLWDCFDTSLLLWLMTHCRKIPVYSMRENKTAWCSLQWLIFKQKIQQMWQFPQDVVKIRAIRQQIQSGSRSAAGLFLVSGDSATVSALMAWSLQMAQCQFFSILPNDSLYGHGAALLEFSYTLPPPYLLPKRPCWE